MSLTSNASPRDSTRSNESIAYVDLQINGAFGVDFNADTLSDSALEDACQRLSTQGVQRFLPTLITAPWEVLMARVTRWVAAYRASSRLQGCVEGLHIEGPFLSPLPGFVGAHQASATCEATLDLAEQLLAAGEGLIRVVTLAPERDPQGLVTRYLADHGVRVMAGHTDASLETMQRAIDQGLVGFTHLGNGTPLLLPRHDNILHRVIALRDRLHITCIADGHHLPWFLLRNWLDLFGIDRVSIVSDAIFAAGLPPGRYAWNHQSIDVDPNGACWASSREHFAGSATLLPQMEVLLRQNLQLDPATLQRLLHANPLRLLRGSAV